MGLMDIVTLPIRLTVAATQVTLGMGQLASPEGPLRRKGGYADQFSSVFGKDGMAEQLKALLADDRPLGRALAPGGALERLVARGGVLDRITDQDGVLEQLFASGGPLDRLLADNGALDRITQQGGLLEVLLREQGFADRLLAEDGFVEKLTVDGGTLDQLLRLGDVLNDLQESVLVLNRAVGPLGELANRVPSGLLRRRTTESGSPQISG